MPKGRSMAPMYPGVLRTYRASVIGRIGPKKLPLKANLTKSRTVGLIAAAYHGPQLHRHGKQPCAYSKLLVIIFSPIDWLFFFFFQLMHPVDFPYRPFPTYCVQRTMHDAAKHAGRAFHQSFARNNDAGLKQLTAQAVRPLGHGASPYRRPSPSYPCSSGTPVVLRNGSAQSHFVYHYPGPSLIGT
ncbi:hypothetical protein BO71DRAFT_202522 [Aspergillus ellipticus CBS 707.79]|uniref:Uncharacterized protein n=1 Tax=Aspergillus ellipticus CBS 707.79 TaxID=1448320 RepID=A0A319DMZ4_9EURO|nr:hypothetical protein BO71DRAFT_202522 [Aspergillus ellipticus CBS 707.79]